MNSLRYIRIVIFRVTQVELASIAGVRQPTVSRWEAGKLLPTLTQLRRIRNEAKRRSLVLNDDLFFEMAA